MIWDKTLYLKFWWKVFFFFFYLLFIFYLFYFIYLFFFLPLVIQILYRQDFACQFAKMSYLQNLLSYMTCNLVLTAMNGFLKCSPEHFTFFEIQDFVISAMIFSNLFAIEQTIVGAWGTLIFEVGYHPHKKIHIIRVVFQDQAMYVRTSFRGAKTCKIWERKGVFLVILTNFGKHMMDKLRKTHAKTCI